MKNILITITVIISFNVASHNDEIQKFVCSCEYRAFNSDYENMQNCKNFSKEGLIINNKDSKIAFQDTEYSFKKNPNTLTATKFLNHSEENLAGDVYQISFEQVTHRLEVDKQRQKPASNESVFTFEVYKCSPNT